MTDLERVSFIGMTLSQRQDHIETLRELIALNKDTAQFWRDNNSPEDVLLALEHNRRMLATIRFLQNLSASDEKRHQLKLF